jgi:hypothetical protein
MFGAECTGISNTEECARQIETLKLSQAQGGASRNGNQLCFRLGSGASKCLSDQSDASFSYLGTLGAPYYHVIWVQYFEGNSVLLVNPRNGRSFEALGEPYPSPKGTHIAFAAWNLISGYGPTKAEIVRADGDNLLSEWSLEPTGSWGPKHPKWRSADFVEFAKIDENQSSVGTLRVRNAGGRSWIVE